MDAYELSEYRRRRLADLLKQKFSDNKAALGKALGYTSGAFVRQMVDGERPITEKTVLKVAELPGCHDWFNENRQAVANEVVHGQVKAGAPLEYAIEILSGVLDDLGDEDRLQAAAALDTLARAPDSQRARTALLVALQRGYSEGKTGSAIALLSGYALDLAKQLDAIPESERVRAHAAASVALSIRAAAAQAGPDATGSPVPPPAKKPGEASRKSR